MKRGLAWAGAILGGLATAFLGLCLGRVLLTPDAAWPPRAWIPPSGPYTVAVLGDSQKGLTNFKNLVRELGRIGPSLTVHTGDLVGENDDGHYRLAAGIAEKLPGRPRSARAARR